MKKENNTDGSDSSENEIPDLDSLKPFQIEPKANIGDINSSSSDGEEECTECKVKRISNSESAVVNRYFSKEVSGLHNFIKKRLKHRCFPVKFTKSLRTPFFTEQLYSDGCFWQ